MKYHGRDGGEIYNALRERFILVRHFKSERIRDYLRVTIGTPEEMDKFYNAICDIVEV